MDVVIKSGIYKILNTKTNKFYIGSSVNLKLRLAQHKTKLKNNKHDNVHLQASYNKHSGWFFEFIILEYCEKDKLIEREQYYIDTLKPEYNMCPTAGNCLGYKQSEDHKKNISNSNKNKLKSEQHKQNISLGKLNKKHSLERIAINIASHRKFDKWPCFDGIRCKCNDCKEKKNNYIIQYRFINKIKTQYSIEAI